MPTIEITPELRQMILDCRAVLGRQIDACKSIGQGVAARPQLIDARMVLAAIADHWRKSLPIVLGKQVESFVLSPEDFRHIRVACGAFKSAESLRVYQPHKGQAKTEIPIVFAIFDRALAGKVFLTQDLPCERQTTL